MGELNISIADAPTTSVYEDFEELWGHVYTLRNGEKVEAPSFYAKYEQAFEEIQWYCPAPGVRSLDEVSIVTIEKRFYPRR
ncbi:hypothetical protein [Alicyclobacillus fodiniaquatilis]|uniref:ASCH domain-containing protein n=1 Tax=Alicyclobacillus fodiniaquatilis TaxID=1661150 RepID=A0ABW4JGB0_9BACL